ncbi:hypothetical protein L5B97_12080 [Avibacterium sp. 20-15]|uniref:hypothetical protein n=1 Tax=unclassified Avibacterium TaxID=2685287 RepID=UPI0020274D60|nr:MULTISPECIES: hypothetical protein [unclassified Avibacterium]MCW9734191.1 hypothetical protein [Avibacterium sp. 20-15]URL03614.1 hypothetical protein L4F93_08575 [Avibacterium sp. 20-132]URL03826.1 hypothetical protein L4F93_09730 [Avibacterium sp. 20-132]
MDFPRTRHQVLHELQLELENWVLQAEIEEIKHYLISIHGGVYPDDWEDILQSHFIKKPDDCHYIQSCSFCQEIVSAILTIAETNRPELKTLFQGK